MLWLSDGSTIVAGGGLNGAIPGRSPRGESLPGFDGGGHAGAVVGLGLSHDGQTLVSVDDAGKIGQWDVARRRLQTPLREGRLSRDTVAFRRDDKMFLVAGNDGDVLVFSLLPSSEPVVCHSGSKQIDGAAFAASDLVAAISADGMLHVWRLGAACELVASAPLVGQRDASQGSAAYRRRLAKAGDGTWIAVTVSSDRVWLIAIDTQAWLERARNVAPVAAR
jgi:WD40 repeat protein